MYVFVALGMQHTMRMRHIFICGLSGFHDIFPHFLINCGIFEKGSLEVKCVF